MTLGSRSCWKGIRCATVPVSLDTVNLRCPARIRPEVRGKAKRRPAQTPCAGKQRSPAMPAASAAGGPFECGHPGPARMRSRRPDVAGPAGDLVKLSKIHYSPRETRTSTTLLPARAGVVPWRRCGRCWRGPAPRTRGGGPPASTPASPRWICSPHARGWSHMAAAYRALGALLPARAGVVLVTVSGGIRTPTAPRTRGGGPSHWHSEVSDADCSPHMRVPPADVWAGIVS